MFNAIINLFTVRCSTKNHKDAVAVTTDLTFVFPDTWDNAKKVEVLTTYAIDALTIKWQVPYRNADKDGVYKKIPATATVTIAEPGRRQADPEAALKTAIAKFLKIPEEKVTAEMLEMLKDLAS
jgi:hypothetical protein